MSEKRIVVVGVGNILLGDEGLGVRAVEELEKKGVPKNVQLYDAGTSLHLVMSSFEGFDKMIIVDAVQAGGEPGTIYRFDLEELEKKGEKIKFMYSLHEIDVPRTLLLERMVSHLPQEVVFLGMEPERVEPGLELSPKVREKMGELISAIEREFC